MNNKEFIAELSKRSGYTQAQTQKLVHTLIAEVGRQAEEGNNITIPNFGTLEVHKRLERIMTTPNSEQRVLVPPKLVLQFRPNTTIKQRLKAGGDGNGK